MTIKLYTQAHDKELLIEIDRTGGRFTADEKTELSRREAGDQFDSYPALLRWYLERNNHKLTALGFLMKHLDERELYRVISFGAGPGVLEHLLRLGLPSEAEVTATDFDEYLISRVQPLLTNIRFQKFDLSNDNVTDLSKAPTPSWDVGVFFGSAYAMNDDEMTRILRQLREVGVAELIDFHAGFLGFRAALRHNRFVHAVGRIEAVRWALRRPPRGFQGKMHGYGRTRGELRRLYRAGGFRVDRELRLGLYEYVAVLTASA